MHAHVTLTVMDGTLAGKKYVFNQPRNCLIGRAEDCEIRLPNELEYLNVSRHHCLLELDPPNVCVRDLGSRNGTYVNGLRIGRKLACSIGRDDGVPFPAFDLYSGDVLRVGEITLWVSILEPLPGAENHAGEAERARCEAFAEPCMN